MPLQQNSRRLSNAHRVGQQSQTDGTALPLIGDDPAYGEHAAEYGDVDGTTATTNRRDWPDPAIRTCTIGRTSSVFAARNRPLRGPILRRMASGGIGRHDGGSVRRRTAKATATIATISRDRSRSRMKRNRLLRKSVVTQSSHYKPQGRLRQSGERRLVFDQPGVPAARQLPVAGRPPGRDRRSFWQRMSICFPFGVSTARRAGT